MKLSTRFTFLLASFALLASTPVHGESTGEETCIQYCVHLYLDCKADGKTELFCHDQVLAPCVLGCSA